MRTFLFTLSALFLAAPAAAEVNYELLNYGCMDEAALNFDQDAEVDDGSCVYDCEFPMIDFTVYCEENDPNHFHVDVTVMTGGNVLPLQITSSIGETGLYISEPGMYELGAFSTGQSVKFFATCQEFGCSLESEEMTMLCVMQDVEEKNVSTFEVFPNPNSGQFQVSLDQSVANGVLEVIDVQGRKVADRRISGNTSSVISIELSSNLETGIYILRLTSDGQSVSKRMLIH